MRVDIAVNPAPILPIGLNRKIGTRVPGLTAKRVENKKRNLARVTGKRRSPDLPGIPNDLLSGTLLF